MNTSKEKIQQINAILQKYFELNSAEQEVPAKDFMPQFIAAGIFEKDHRNGLPIRNILRQLDSAGQLQQIPYVIPRRKAKNTNWYFGPYNIPS